MKLAKLSLAAIVAAGALTTVNAQPLEEAIKGVEFSGMLRYRLNNVDVSNTTSSSNDFDFLAKFTAPVTDDIKAVMAFASSSAAGNNKASGLPSDVSPSDAIDVDLRKAFFVYNKDALTVKAGMQALGLPSTDNGFNGNKAVGVVGLYNAGFATFAAAYFSGMNANGSSGYTRSSDELMAVAAIGSMGPVNAQLWAAKSQEVIDSWIFLDLSAKFAGVSLQGQAISTTLDSAIATAAGFADDSGMFYALKAGYAMDNFKFNLGYTQTDKDMGIHSLEEDVNTDVIVGGWRISDDGNDYNLDQRVIFADASVSFGKVGVTVGYADLTVDSAANMDMDEIWGEVSYAYSKNLNTYVKYSTVNADAAADIVDGQDYLRFEAKYSF